MFIFISLLALSLISFAIHIYLRPQDRILPKVVELLLLYQLVFSLGMTSFLAFFGLTFMAEFVAAYTGWPSCPFEQQLANVNLGYGVLGTLCIWLRGHFWTATILGFSIWIIGDGIAHLHEMIVHSNYTPGNIGVPLVTDFLVPFVLLALLAWHLWLEKHPPSNP